MTSLKTCSWCVVVLGACAGDGRDVDGKTIAVSDPNEDGHDSCTVDRSYQPVIDPARFVDGVDNPLFPLPPGAVWVYESGDEEVTVTVTDERRLVLGVSTVVVHDVARVDGEITEDTYDYYAQDVDGAVWYMGEATTAFDNGTSSTEGSWEAGVDLAKPGILIPADPTVGVPYRQEYYACHAEDMGEVVSTCKDVTLGIGCFESCLETVDTTPLEPDVSEQKFYCPGTGLVLTIDQETGEREELVQLR